MSNVILNREKNNFFSNPILILLALHFNVLTYEAVSLKMVAEYHR